MKLNEIIEGLRFAVYMFLTDPATGERLTEPRNEKDKIAVNACRQAMLILERLERTGTMSEYRIFKVLETIKNECENNGDCYQCPYDETICFGTHTVPENWKLKALRPTLLSGDDKNGS